MTNGLAHWLTILTPLIVLFGQLYARRDRNVKQTENLKKTAEVHTLVNGQSETQQAEIDELRKQLGELKAVPAPTATEPTA